MLNSLNCLSYQKEKHLVSHKEKRKGLTSHSPNCLQQALGKRGDLGEGGADDEMSAIKRMIQILGRK